MSILAPNRHSEVTSIVVENFNLSAQGQAVTAARQVNKYKLTCYLSKDSAYQRRIINARAANELWSEYEAKALNLANRPPFEILEDIRIFMKVSKGRTRAYRHESDHALTIDLDAFNKEYNYHRRAHIEGQKRSKNLGVTALRA